MRDNDCIKKDKVEKLKTFLRNYISQREDKVKIKSKPLYKLLRSYPEYSNIFRVSCKHHIIRMIVKITTEDKVNWVIHAKGIKRFYLYRPSFHAIYIKLVDSGHKAEVKGSFGLAGMRLGGKVSSNYEARSAYLECWKGHKIAYSDETENTFNCDICERKGKIVNIPRFFDVVK